MNKIDKININIPYWSNKILTLGAEFGFELWGFIFMVTKDPNDQPNLWMVYEYTTGTTIPHGEDYYGRFYWYSLTKADAIKYTKEFLEYRGEDDFRERYNEYIKDANHLGIINFEKSGVT